jgi:hypothetical protein
LHDTHTESLTDLFSLRWMHEHCCVIWQIYLRKIEEARGTQAQFCGQIYFTNKNATSKHPVSCAWLTDQLPWRNQTPQLWQAQNWPIHCFITTVVSMRQPMIHQYLCHQQGGC